MFPGGTAYSTAQQIIVQATPFLYLYNRGLGFWNDLFRADFARVAMTLAFVANAYLRTRKVAH